MRRSCEGNSPSEREPFGIALFDRRHRLAGHPGEGGDLSFSGRAPQPSKAPCFSAFLLPLRSPASGPMHPADLDPRTAGAWHCSPLLFDLAWHLDARCIGQCMGLFLRFFACPHPRRRGADVADDRLPALGDMDVRPEMNWSVVFEIRHASQLLAAITPVCRLAVATSSSRRAAVREAPPHSLRRRHEGTATDPA